MVKAEAKSSKNGARRNSFVHKILTSKSFAIRILWAFFR
jgi:hypothetical protein